MGKIYVKNWDEIPIGVVVHLGKIPIFALSGEIERKREKSEKKREEERKGERKERKRAPVGANKQTISPIKK